MDLSLMVGDVKFNYRAGLLITKDNKDYHELFFLYKLNVEDKDDRFMEDMINYDSEKSYYKWVDKDKLDEVNLLPKPIRNISTNDEFESIIVKD